MDHSVAQPTAVVELDNIENAATYEPYILLSQPWALELAEKAPTHENFVGFKAGLSRETRT